MPVCGRYGKCKVKEKSCAREFREFDDFSKERKRTEKEKITVGERERERESSVLKIRVCVTSLDFWYFPYI